MRRREPGKREAETNPGQFRWNVLTTTASAHANSSPSSHRCHRDGVSHVLDRGQSHILGHNNDHIFHHGHGRPGHGLGHDLGHIHLSRQPPPLGRPQLPRQRPQRRTNDGHEAHPGCGRLDTNLGNEQMKPQQIKQKSQFEHQSQVAKRHGSETFERLSCAVFSLRGSPPFFFFPRGNSYHLCRTRVGAESEQPTSPPPPLGPCPPPSGAVLSRQQDDLCGFTK